MPGRIGQVVAGLLGSSLDIHSPYAMPLEDSSPTAPRVVQSGRIEVDEGRLYYETTGRGDAIHREAEGP